MVYGKFEKLMACTTLTACPPLGETVWVRPPIDSIINCAIRAARRPPPAGPFSIQAY